MRCLILDCGKSRGCFVKRYRKNIVLIILAAILVTIFLAPLAAQYDPKAMVPRQRLQAPSEAHWLGTDEFGRDVFSRVAHGGRTSLLIGLAVVTITVVVGTVVGALCGWNIHLDRIVMRIFDGWMAFPEIILAIALAAVWGAGQYVIIFAMAFAYTPRMARVARGAVLTVKSRDYIEAVRAIGARESYALVRHVLPNSLAPVVVQATYNFASAILAEAALSFLGVGIQPPAPSWGGMISDARNYIPVAPWLVVFPSLAMFAAVLALNLLGDQLQDRLDPYQEG